jgi:hypothetical protein
MLRAIGILIVGVAVLVCAATGYMLQSSLTSAIGWGFEPIKDGGERLLLGAMGLVFVPVGLLLVYKRQ